jgi:hypothetical protein
MRKKLIPISDRRTTCDVQLTDGSGLVIHHRLTSHSNEHITDKAAIASAKKSISKKQIKETFGNKKVWWSIHA